jgi:hypothetical protein
VPTETENLLWFIIRFFWDFWKEFLSITFSDSVCNLLTSTHFFLPR